MTADGPDRDGEVEAEAERSVDACRRCPALVESRTQIVNGVGPPTAELLFVGEAPGAEEDAAGEPFVGRSGGILDDALRQAGAARRDVRISNAVRCRPPENRDPHESELDHCRSHLEGEIAAVDPSLVVALGKVPAEHLLDRSVAVTQEMGNIETIELGGRPRDVMVSVHPAATLYDRSQRSAFEAAIEDAVKTVDGPGQTSLGEF